MDLDALNASPIGQLVPVRGYDARHGDFAYFAYLPDPLPADVELESATWTAVSQASMAIAKLDQICRQLPDPRLLIRPALWREALDTSALEGTVGGLQELLEAQLTSAQTQYIRPEAKEIRDYLDVANRAFEDVKTRPVSLSLLSEYHKQLLENAREKPRMLGALRDDVVWIGDRERPIDEARFVPPPADDRLRAGVDAWEAWVRLEHPDLPPVLRAALAHYQFETLHPFGDGNGRLGRLVIVLQLLRSGIIDQPGITVSPWFLRNRDQYQEELLAVSCTGNWNPWVRFFCEAVRVQCDRLGTGAERLVEWSKASSAQLHERRWTGKIHQLLADLIEWPVVNIADTAERYGVSVVHATRMVDHLVEVGVLKELTGRKYGRVFGALFVMDTVDVI